MATINQRIREASPEVRGPRERLIHAEGDWQVERCFTSTRYERRVSGLEVRVVDYSELVYWQVLGVLSGIDLTASGRVQPDSQAPEDGLRLAQAQACAAAEFLNAIGVDRRPH